MPSLCWRATRSKRLLQGFTVKILAKCEHSRTEGMYMP